MRILYLQYTSPANYPPLEHSGLILLNGGWDVAFFGIRCAGQSGKLAFPGPLAARQTLWSHSPPGWRQKLHYVRFTLKALAMTLGRRTDWVYCSDLLSCPAAWLIGRLTRSRVLYHEHDSPEDGAWPPERGAPATEASSRFHRFLLWTRQQVGRQADLVVLPNAKRLEYFRNMAGRRRTSLCVFNCPRKDEVAMVNRASAVPGILRLVFHGSINRERLPLAMLEAMSRLPGRVHLSIVGYETVGSQGYLREFIQEAERLGLGRAVEFLGAMPRHAIFAPALKGHVGLAFMPLRGGDVNMANMTGASNKPFDYLACGLALLVSARPDWEEVFVRPGYGLSCDPGDADSLARQLRWFLEHPAETREMGARGRRKIATEWNYEYQFAPLLEMLTLHPAAPPG